MKKKNYNFRFQIDFKKNTPQMQIGEYSTEELYKKAFLEDEKANKPNEFNHNTASFD